jgi:hypothetical protein
LRFNVEKRRFYNAQPFEATFQGLNHQASPHVMTKNDYAKEINTYFEQKNATTTNSWFLKRFMLTNLSFFTINKHVHFVKKPKA